MWGDNIVTLKDINKAIVIQTKEGLKGTNYETVEFQSTDIKEGFTRPCFYVEFAENKTGLWNKFHKERTLEIKLYYFPRDKCKYKLELMEVQDLLENIFLRDLKVSDTFYFFIEELDFDITPDGILISTFTLYSIEEIPIIETEELIGDININSKTTI